MFMRRSFVAITIALVAAAYSLAYAQAPLSDAEARLGARLIDSATLNGVVVKQIVPDQAADRAGLETQDLILRFEGEAVHDLSHFSSLALQASGGQKLPIEVLRETKIIKLQVVLPAAAAAPEEAQDLRAVEARIRTLEQQLADLKAKRRELLARATQPGADVGAGLPATVVGVDSQTMVLIPAGEFIMGTGEAKRIYLDAFYIDLYEVTNAMWDRYGVSKRRPKSLCDRCPVINVSWYEVESYCKKAGKRLPTEFEWEKTARGPEGLAYVWGNQFRPGLANVKSDSDKHPFTASIGSFSFDKSPYGVFDLAGNVAEWTSSRYESGYYATMPRSNPKGPDGGDFRVFRGGSWESRKEKTLATTRDWSFPEERYESVGFRCVKDAP
jgi:iron(II)-dependent oxidoreductase